MNNEIKNYVKELYGLHFNKLKNIGLDNPKVLICFSGIPGSGKTYLAKKIEEMYGGLRINNDEIRAIIKKIVPQDDNFKEKSQNILENYVFSIISSELKNGLIILDSGIDRRYLKVKEVSDKLGYKIFIIKIEIEEVELKNRIGKRSVEDQEHFKTEYGRWKEEFMTFNKSVKANIIIKSGNLSDRKRLFLELDRFLSF